MRSNRTSENLAVTDEETIQTVPEKENSKSGKRKRKLGELFQSLGNKTDQLARIRDSLLQTVGPGQRSALSGGSADGQKLPRCNFPQEGLTDPELGYRLSSLLDFLRQLYRFEDCGVFLVEDEDDDMQRLLLSSGPAGSGEPKDFEDEIGAQWRAGGIKHALDQKKRVVIPARQAGSLLVIPFRVLDQMGGFCVARFRESDPLKKRSSEELLSWTELVSSCVENYCLKRAQPGPSESRWEESEAQKLCNTLRLSKALVHEVNNSLQVIMGRTQLLKMSERKAAKPASGTKNLEKIEANANRVCSIMKDFSDYLHRQFNGTADAGEVNLQHILRGDLALLDYILTSERIKVDLDCDDNLPAIYGNPGELERGFLSLMWEIKDLLACGGSVSLCTSADGESFRLNIRCRGNDDPADESSGSVGPQISDKPDVVSQILQKHQGELKSERGEDGTVRFRLTFPLASRMKANGQSA
jgi:hypothetical protein